jgi:uncharacterized protein (DUF302 family)
MSTKQFINEELSPLTFDETVESTIEIANQKGWNIPFIHDLQQSLAKSGKMVKPVKVIEICKPEYSGKMLELNHERLISVLMPCRIAIYAKDDGNTYLASLNPGMMIEGMTETAAMVMKSVSDELSEIVKLVTGELV